MRFLPRIIGAVVVFNVGLYLANLNVGGVGEPAIARQLAESTAGPTFVRAPERLMWETWETWAAKGLSGQTNAVQVGDEVHHLPAFSVIGVQRGGVAFLRLLLSQHSRLESGEGLHGEARGGVKFSSLVYTLEA